MSDTADRQGDRAAVLVVEDEVMLLMLVAETLRDAGFTVLEASNGTTALQALREHPEVGLMISDIKMPGMNGYEVAQEGLTLRPELKVVLMTGYTQDPMPARFAEANVQVLHKPFNFDLLPELAKEMLGC